jgi:hypothetical protein
LSRRTWLFCILVGCGGTETAVPNQLPVTALDPPWSGPLAPAAANGDEVVATVEGTPIYASEVATQMAAESQDARQALEALVARELLATEARRRGFLEDPDTAEARRRVRTRRLVEDGFARQFDGPEDIPAEAVTRAWNHPRVRTYYDHPRTHVVRYCRLPVGGGVTEEQAKARAEDVWKKVSAARPADGEAFSREVAAAYGNPLPTHRQTVIEDSGLDASFVEAAFSVSEVGEVAKPKRTPWGWDILYLEHVVPERHTSFAEAEPEIRRERFEVERAAAFTRWADALAAKAKIWRDDSWLARIAVASPLELR